MGSRKLNKKKIDEEIRTAVDIAKRMKIQIKYYFDNDELNEREKIFLIKSNEYIDQIIEKYENKCIIFWEYLENLDEVEAEFEKLFEIEDIINKDIAKSRWNNYFSEVNDNFKQGDTFKYLAHFGDEIINLPGRLGYRKNRNFNGDYISASIISNNTITPFEGKHVGLILNPNGCVLGASSTDSSTSISKEESVRGIFSFEDGTKILSGNYAFMEHGDELTGIVTKIQHPAWSRNLIRSYYKDVVEGAEFNEDSRAKIDEVFSKMIEYSYCNISKKNINWEIIETTDSDVIKAEQYIGESMNAKIFLLCHDGEYSVKFIQYNRPDVISEGVTKENCEGFYDTVKQILKKWVDKEDSKIRF